MDKEKVSLFVKSRGFPFFLLGRVGRFEHFVADFLKQKLKDFELELLMLEKI